MKTATDRLQVQDKVRRILTDERSPLSSCWFASLRVSDLQLPTTEGEAEEYSFDAEVYLSELELAISQTVPDFNRAKILAGAAAVFTDLAFRDMRTFNDFANLCNANDPPLPGVYNPANTTECALAVFELALITTDQSPREVSLIPKAFSPEILTYWGVVLESEGAASGLAPLSTAILSAVDPLADPMLFSAMDSQSSQFGDALKQAVYQYAADVFKQLNGLPGIDGKPCLTAAQMQGVFDTLMGVTA